MMCYTPANVSFTPLFRLLDGFDNYSREVQATPASRPRRSKNQRSSLTTLHPKFDVRETENTYELHGELPGLERENVSIEFTEPQTVVIQGRVERSYGPDSNNSDDDDDNAGGASTETESSRRNSHHATVEDDPEDGTRPASTSTPATSAKTDVAKSSSQTQEAANKQTQNEPKCWLWERSVGEFSRAFSFPAPVDQDGVTASLNNGILSVVVPKAKKPAPRRIEITAS